MEKYSYFENISFLEDRPAVSIMIKNPHVKELRLAFKAGQQMKSHKAPCAIVVQVLRGKIDFGVLENRYMLVDGDCIFVENSVMHDLNALEESIVRVTLIMNE